MEEQQQQQPEINKEEQEEQVETKAPRKKRPKSKPAPLLATKLAILQMPEDTDPEVIQHIKQHLDEIVVKFDLEKAEVRLNKPDKGGRQKKYQTVEDEKAHYKEYFKQYYKEKLDVPGTCPNCLKEFKTKSSIPRHMKKSVNCLRLRIQKELLLAPSPENDNLI